MDFPTTQSPRGYPESMGSKPLLFSPHGNANVMGRETARQHPMRDYGYLDDWPLAECNHPAEWVKTVFLHKANFVKGAELTPESKPSSCQYLLDNYNLGYEGVAGDSNMATTLHDMVGKHSVVRFPHKIDIRHWASITRDLRYMFWLSDCL